MARQAEAERERRAKIISSEGEFQAAEKLKDAAIVLEKHPVALQLRYLQTMLEVSSGTPTSTIIFPAPIDIIRPFLEHTGESIDPEQRREARSGVSTRSCQGARRHAFPLGCANSLNKRPVVFTAPAL